MYSSVFEEFANGRGVCFTIPVDLKEIGVRKAEA